MTLPRLFFSFRQVAAMVGVRRQTIAELVAEGTIRTVDRNGRPVIPRDEVERLTRDGVPRPGAKAKRRARRAGGGEPGTDIRRIDV